MSCSQADIKVCILGDQQHCDEAKSKGEHFEILKMFKMFNTVSAPGLDYHAELGVHTVRIYSSVAMSSTQSLCWRYETFGTYLVILSLFFPI